MKFFCIKKQFFLVCIAFLAVAPHLSFSENKATSISSVDELLNRVKEGSIQDRKRLQQREAAFKAHQENQRQLLQEARQAFVIEEKLSAALEAQFEKNEIALTAQKKRLDEKLGTLKELFGHITGTAKDLKTTLRTSLTSTQFQGREVFLETLIEKLNSNIELPAIEDIEQLWFKMQQEIVEGGKVVRFDTQVSKPDGSQMQQSVIRVGTYHLVSKGKYLQFNSDTGSVFELSKQPNRQYRDYIAELESLTEGFKPLGVDPTGPKGGRLLNALMDTPSLVERWHQGGVIGYMISITGFIALLIAVWRFVSLITLDVGVARQRTLQQARVDNPLGRVLKVYEDHPRMDPESLELKLAEAMIKERPEIEKGLSVLKLVAMVAPLMGLLGTVTGMITAFQAITTFGAGDPQAMAGSISTALVTTALGLLVAIPSLLLHALLNARAKRILQIIEQQSVGIIAEQAEIEEQTHVRAV